ncbi:hypothetical protein AEO54_c009 [Vibrio phage vB_VorS-PVo5]|nr:hypothetical protein AEO54_c009 [Vibrio phage vB_VorS-PVo5]
MIYFKNKAGKLGVVSFDDAEYEHQAVQQPEELRKDVTKAVRFLPRDCLPAEKTAFLTVVK